jgi:thiol-disulfide isomerase/thioredoxin
MNKKLLVTVIGIILLICGAIAYVTLTPRTAPSVPTSEQSTPSTRNETTPTEAPVNKPGEYSDYTAEKVGTANGTVLLFFHASWCPQCREIEASIERDGLPSNVTVLKVDYDSSQTLRQRYGVTLQTTFVKVDASGSRIASYVAYEEPRFSAVARELLP